MICTFKIEMEVEADISPQQTLSFTELDSYISEALNRWSFFSAPLKYPSLVDGLKVRKIGIDSGRRRRRSSPFSLRTGEEGK